MKIQKFIMTSLITAIFAILFVIIFEEAFAMFDFYDILIILAAIVSSTLGLIISKKVFRFEFENNAKDGAILAIFSWLIYAFYFFIQYFLIYPIDLIVLVGLFIGFFLYFIIPRLGPNFNAPKMEEPLESVIENIPFLRVSWMRIVSLVSKLFFGAIFGSFIGQFSWIFIGIVMNFQSFIFIAPLSYIIAWAIAGALGFPLHYASKGRN